MSTMVLAAFAALATLQPAAVAQPRPVQPAESWFSVADYPTEARKAEVEGAVSVRLDVDSGGAPTACAVERSAGPLLDAATCRILIERGRFHPARDAHGNAVAGTFTLQIVWRFPPPPPALPFAPLRILDILEVAADGTTRCDPAAPLAGPRRVSIEICGVALAIGLADGFLRDGTAARMTVVLSVTPNDQPDAPAIGAEAGTLIYRAGARVIVAPAGHLSVCVETEPPRGSRRPRKATPLCLAYLRGDGPNFERVAAGARSGVITLSVYMADPPSR